MSHDPINFIQKDKTVVFDVEKNVTKILPTTKRGPKGQGVPVGGAAGQVLTKDTATDYDTSWQNPAGGGGGLAYNDFSATAPVAYDSSGNYSIPQANTNTDGYLSSTDWDIFNSKASTSQLFSGNYSDLNDKPTLFSGQYSDLTSTPTIPDDLNDLSDNNNLLFSGSYNDLINTPSLFSGSYTDLTNKPTIPTNNNQLTNGAGYLTSFAETDPTVPSHVKTISTNDIANWNAAEQNVQSDWNAVSGDALILNKPIIPNSLNDLSFDVGGVSKTEFGYLNGATGGIQSQIDAKVDIAGDTMSGNLIIDTSGTSNITLDRGGDSNFAGLRYLTTDFEKWYLGLRNDNTEQFHIRDSINNLDAMRLIPGVVPEIDFLASLSLSNNISAAEYQLWNEADINVPYDVLKLQRSYNQNTVSGGDPYATLLQMRAPENSAEISAVDTANNTVTTLNPHLFSTGAGIIMQNIAGGVVPQGLIANYVYYARAVSSAVLSFHPTRNDALNNTNVIDLQSDGGGTNIVYLSTQEATLSLKRLSGTANEFMDLYANGYESGYQFGIRVQKRGVGAELRPFIIGNDDGSTQHILAYFDNLRNRVGINTASPGHKLDVDGDINTSGAYRVDGNRISTNDVIQSSTNLYSQWQEVINGVRTSLAYDDGAKGLAVGTSTPTHTYQFDGTEITGTGTVAIGPFDETITGTNTQFLSQVQVDDYLAIANGKLLHVVSVQSDTQLTVYDGLFAGFSNQAFTVLPSLFKLTLPTGGTAFAIDGRGLYNLGAGGKILAPADNSSAGVGYAITVSGGRASDGAGGISEVRGGGAGGTNQHGGHLVLAGGSGTGTAENGHIMLNGGGVFAPQQSITGIGAFYPQYSLPGATLDVKGSVNSQPVFRVQDSSGKSAIEADKDGAVSFKATSSVVTLNVLTTTQKNALTPHFGQIVADSDLNKVQFYDGTNWVSLN